MTTPASRNLDDSCGHCLNAGGPSAVNSNGAYTHGLCGNVATDSPQNWNAADASSITALGTAGDSVMFEVKITAHHHGYWEFELCDSPDISEECFRQHKLTRSGCDPADFGGGAAGQLACERYWKPLTSAEYTSYTLQPQGYPNNAPFTDAGVCNYVVYKHYFDLPSDVSCTHCVLRWHYQTSNSCTSDGANSEEFWNCADVSIQAAGGSTTADTSVADLDALNAVLTSTAPSDISGDLEAAGISWGCPDPSYGVEGEYSCSLDGTADDTSGCVATDGSSCNVQFYSVGTPLYSHCTWSICDENSSGGGGYCDESVENCENNCGGSWCVGLDPDTTVEWQYTTTTEASGSTTTEVSGSTTTEASGSTVQSTTTTGPVTTTNSGDGWLPDLAGTHFWDCNGGACDATVLQPWDESEYSYAPQYAPQDPEDYGGAVYGEKMWMTGAASDALSDLLGNDDGCCGAEDSGIGGCGKCVLVRNPSAVNSDWTAVVMKKNRCPPWSPGCETGNVHLDMAAPGYDNLAFSTANICGAAERSETFLTEEESSICGSWWSSGSSTIDGCDCSGLPDATPEQAMLKRGCELFSSWGWTSGDPTLDYQVVDCPAEFVSLVGGAFDVDGVQPVPPVSTDPSTTAAQSTTNGPPPTTTTTAVESTTTTHAAPPTTTTTTVAATPTTTTQQATTTSVTEAPCNDQEELLSVIAELSDMISSLTSTVVSLSARIEDLQNDFAGSQCAAPAATTEPPTTTTTTTAAPTTTTTVGGLYASGDGSCSFAFPNSEYCVIETKDECEAAADYLQLADTTANVITRSNQVAGCSTNNKGGLRLNQDFTSQVIHTTGGQRQVLCGPCPVNRRRRRLRSS